MYIRIFILSFLVLFAFKGIAQNPKLDVADVGIFRDALELYDKKKYTAAQRKFATYIKSGQDDDKRIQSAYYKAVCALYLKQANAEELILYFLEEHPTHPIARNAYFDLGNYYFEKEKFKQATNYLRKCTVARPITQRDIEATYKLGYSYFFEKKYQKAKPLFDKIKTGVHPYVSLASYYAGYIGYLNKSYDVAITDLQRAAEDKQFKAEIETLIPSIYYKREEYDKVKEVVTEYENANRGMSSGLSLLAGEIYYREKDYNKAAKYLETHVKAEKKAARDVYYRLGMSKLRTQERNDAIRYLSKAADGEDGLAQAAAYHLGIAYISIKKTDFADVAFDKVRKLNYDSTLKELGAYYYVKVNYDNENYTNVVDGSDFYQETFPQGPNFEKVLAFSSEALLKTGNYNKAMENIEKISNKSTKIKQAYQQIAYNKAVLDFNDGRFRQAVDNLVKSIRYPIDQELKSEALFSIGETYAFGNKFKIAIPYYEKVEEKYEIYTAALYGKAYCHYNLKEYEEALTTFQSYLQRPANPDAEQKIDALVRLADCYYVTKNYDQAIQVYSGAIKAGAKDMGYVYYQKALAEIAAGRLNDANRSLDYVILNFPNAKNFDRIYFEKAMLNFDNGRREDAIDWFTRFIERFPSHPQLPSIYLKRGLAYKLIDDNASAVSDYKRVLDDYTTSSAAESAIRSLQEIHTNGYAVANLREYRNKFADANPESSVALEAEFGAAIKPFNEGEYELAIGTLSEFARKYPNVEMVNDAYFKLGYSYELTGQKVNAIEYYKKVQGAPLLKATKNAADLELEIGKYEDAVTDYLKVKKLATNKRYEQFAIVGLMKAYLGIDDFEAVELYASQIIEQRLTRYINLAYLYKGKSLMKQKRYADAIAQLTATTSVSQGKEGAEAQFLIGVILHEQKDYQSSINALIDVKKNYENYPEWIYPAFLLLAENYIQLDNTFQAKETLKSIVENANDPAVVQKAQAKLDTL
ncbi:MAG: tetratricopeptide repeat protein [Flammeovirgaceae bacterium]